MRDAARELASLIWDPENASLGNSKYSACTAGEAALTKKLGCLVLGDKSEASSAPQECKVPWKAIDLIEESESRQLVDVIDEMVQAHETLAKKKANRKNCNFFIACEALMFASLGIEKGLFEANELCFESPFFPVELLLS